MNEKIVIIGGDAAGMSAASVVARDEESTAQVTVLEMGDVTSYAACGLPYFVSGDIEDSTTLLVRDQEFFTERGIDLRLNHEVVEINRNSKQVKVLDVRAGEKFDLDYDKLLIATGATAAKPPIPGIDAPNVFSIRHYNDALNLSGYLNMNRPKRVTVLGASYLGLEMVEAMRAQGLEVTVVEVAEQVFPMIDNRLALLLADELEKNEIGLKLGEPVTELVRGADGNIATVHTKSSNWPCDLVILGLGSRPTVDLARAAGLAIGPSGAIEVSDSLQTNDESIWAAGDCVATNHRITGGPVWIPLGPAANKQGRIAGARMIGKDVRFRGVVGTSLVKVFDLHAGSTGLTETAALAAGFDPISCQITGSDIAHYYPGSKSTTIKLVVDRKTEKLLGGQVVGYTGVAGRVNVLATALHAGMTIQELAELDLGYAPPFAPVWDPILIAANKVVGSL